MKKYLDYLNNKTLHIRDFQYVIDFFKNCNENINIEFIQNIPVHIISYDNWPEGKPLQTESNFDNIRMYEGCLKNHKFCEKIGWLIHEVGHILYNHGLKKPFIVKSKKFTTYPNVENEQTPMYFQFKYLIENGLTVDDVIRLEKESYDDVKNDKSLWNNYKNNFFLLYYNELKNKII